MGWGEARCRSGTRAERDAGRARAARARASFAAAATAASLLLACGPATGEDAPPGSSTAVVHIDNFQFSPTRITAAPGSAVLFQVLDGLQHALASETAAGSHVPAPVGGVDFYTPPFTDRWTVTVPATASPGTVIPYFCVIHAGAGADGEIVVAAP